MRARTTSTPSSSAARKPACPPSAPAEAAPLHVAIDRVGHLGDGLGTTEDGRSICVPASLPGELAVIQPSGQRGGIAIGHLSALLAASPDRVPPLCPHFGMCGGCALQHWAVAPYLAWKTNLLREALLGAGYIDPPLRPIVPAAPGERRRIEFAFSHLGRSITLGLHRAHGREIVDIASCAVLHPSLQALLTPLRALLAQLPSAGGGGRVAINLLDTGADITVRADGMPGTGERTKIGDFARSHRVARVHWACGTAPPEAICILAAATIRFADVEVAVPPDAFLQATRSGEAAIVAATLDALKPGRGKLLDLYAGCGTLTFPLANQGHVTAYEGNQAALDALRVAANRALPGRITSHHRDLVRQPLGPRELAGYAAVVIDPPWAGAPVQIAAIAKSAIKRVIYVSCHPGALRRDAQMLRLAGFALGAATPIDQFLWSAQLESVSVFTR
jgi:23S rRNA (uracil1939-C5)-methyltransferase